MLCNEQVSVDSFVSYHALDLQSVIEKRKMEDNRFSTREILYLLSSLVDLGLYLKSTLIVT